MSTTAAGILQAEHRRVPPSADPDLQPLAGFPRSVGEDRNGGGGDSTLILRPPGVENRPVLDGGRKARKTRGYRLDSGNAHVAYYHLRIAANNTSVSGKFIFVHRC